MVAVGIGEVDGLALAQHQRSFEIDLPFFQCFDNGGKPFAGGAEREMSIPLPAHRLEGALHIQIFRLEQVDFRGFRWLAGGTQHEVPDVFRVAFGDFEPQHPGIERLGAVEVAHVEANVMHAVEFHGGIILQSPCSVNRRSASAGNFKTRILRFAQNDNQSYRVQRYVGWRK